MQTINSFFEKHSKATRILALVLCIFLLAVAGNLVYSPGVKKLHILVNDQEIHTQPIARNTSLIVEDGAVRELAEGEQVDLNSTSQINVFELRDGFLACVAANCSDQQCVYAGEINAASDNDMIVCYEHSLVAFVK